ncbi:MAG: AraC family transcriptional regulator [Bdellovibrio sp.]|nr:AraC family transcriptional regulator [Bdellovibrio sp.]
MDHLTRLQRAIDYIEDHLKDDLPTEIIAKEACFSMWHFQKIFSSMVGDIYGSWLPKSGAELRDAPDLEVYDQRFVPGAES